MLSTTPANSEAGENGNAGFTWYLPAISSVSKKFSAADLIATTTSPEPGVGLGRSVSARSSGPPKRVHRMAFMGNVARRNWRHHKGRVAPRHLRETCAQCVVVPSHCRFPPLFL